MTALVIRWSGQGFLFAEAENVFVDVFHVEVLMAPRPLLKWFGDPCATRLQLLVQCLDARNGGVRIEVLMLLAVCSVANRLGSTLEMYREAVATHARVERLVSKIHLKAELVSVISNRRIKIVHKKLWCDCGEPCCAANYYAGSNVFLSCSP